MRIEIGNGFVAMYRDTADRAIKKESAVITMMMLLLKREGHKVKRIQPYRYGMTACMFGFILDEKYICWHERYQIESMENVLHTKNRVVLEKVSLED